MQNNTVQLPPQLYEAVSQQAAEEHKSPDTLVAEWLAERLDQPLSNGEPAAFQEEIAAFERLKPTLLQQQPGLFVAIYQGKVVASGQDKLALFKWVQRQLGPVHCYVELVDADSPRTVRVPSTWIASA